VIRDRYPDLLIAYAVARTTKDPDDAFDSALNDTLGDELAADARSVFDGRWVSDDVGLAKAGKAVRSTMMHALEWGLPYGDSEISAIFDTEAPIPNTQKQSRQNQRQSGLGNRISGSVDSRAVMTRGWNTTWWNKIVLAGVVIILLLSAKAIFLPIGKDSCTAGYNGYTGAICTCSWLACHDVASNP
jgi:hypothetical protein